METLRKITLEIIKFREAACGLGGSTAVLRFLLRRSIHLIPTLLLISVITFVVIELPPGDYAGTLAAQLETEGATVSTDQVEAFRAQFGYGEPAYIRYLQWFGGVLHGDFGYSFQFNKSVNSLIWGRLGLTAALSLCSLLLAWAIALPVAVYSAMRKYSLGDYLVTFLNVVGLATPDFLLALVLLWVAFAKFGVSAVGLFSEQYREASWGMGKAIDLLKHLWIPALIVGLNSTAGVVRILRANLLDEMNKLYVINARAKGMPEWKLIWKYPVRVALIPCASTLGWLLPNLLSSTTIVSVVLNLPTNGPLLLGALMSQDMYLAGSFVFLLSLLTVLGTFLSDLLLAWLDPRILLD